MIERFKADQDESGDGNGNGTGITRRDFIKTSAAASLAAAIPSGLGLYAAGSDTIRIGCTMTAS